MLESGRSETKSLMPKVNVVNFELFFIDQDFTPLWVLTLSLESHTKSENGGKDGHEIYIVIRSIPFSAYCDAAVCTEKMMDLLS